MTNDRGFDALLYLRAWAGQEKQLFFISLCFDNRHRNAFRRWNNFHFT